MSENSVLDFREVDLLSGEGEGINNANQRHSWMAEEQSLMSNGFVDVTNAEQDSLSSVNEAAAADKSVTDAESVISKVTTGSSRLSGTSVNSSVADTNMEKQYSINNESMQNGADNNISAQQNIVLSNDSAKSNSTNSLSIESKSAMDRKIENSQLTDSKIVDHSSSVLSSNVSFGFQEVGHDESSYDTTESELPSSDNIISSINRSAATQAVNDNSRTRTGLVKSKLFGFVSALDDICDKLSLMDEPAEHSVNADIVNQPSRSEVTTRSEITSDNISCSSWSNEIGVLATEKVAESSDISQSKAADLISNVSELLANSDDFENDLIAELETECGSMSNASSVTVSNGLKSSGGSVDVAEYELLRSRYQALEQRLKHSVDSRRVLEMDVVKLERKLQATTISKTTAAKTADDKITELEFNLSEAKDMLTMQEEVFKQKEVDLLAENQSKTEQIQKQLDESQREKEVAIIRYAQAEQRNLEIQDKLSRTEARLRDWTKEREVALGKWHKMKDEKKTAIDLCEQKMAEIVALKKDLEAQKELVSSADVKLKWNQNKLKSEQDALKETQTKLDEQNRYVCNAKEEILVVMDQLRTMYKELNINPSHHASESQNKKEATANTLEELLLVLKKSIGTLMWKQQELTEELRTFHDKVKCLEVERQSQESALSTFKSNLDGQRQGNSDLRERILELENSQQKVQELEMRLTEVTHRAEELETQNRDLLVDAERSLRIETEHLCFTEKMSERLTGLQAENSHLHYQVTTLSEQNEEALQRVRHLEEERSGLEKELTELKQHSSSEISSLKAQLQNEQQKAFLAETQMGEAQNEAKVLKRKCVSIQKDMAKQLAQIARRQEGKLSTDGLSLGSRGSCGSLDTVGLAGTYSREMSPQEEIVVIERQSNDVSSTPVTSQHDGCLDQITHLQKIVARSKDKLSFLQEHTEQLTEEINRKAKIIREYVLREEAGSLSSESSDNAKAQLSRKGGVMASVYTSHNRGGGMTLELSLEINRKLQALLEDTLLKNIKLKEGMDTLGTEIEWLSRENKRLLQQLKDNQNNQHSDDTSSQDSRIL